MTVTMERVYDLANRSAHLRARGDYHLQQDLAQEAAIKAWRAMAGRPDAREPYVQMAIIHGLNNAQRGYVTGGGVGIGKGAAMHRPDMHVELSDLIEDKFVGTVDSYPCLEDDAPGGGWFAGALLVLDGTKRELMRRKYLEGQPDAEIREEMGLSQNQANVHHRWAKQALRAHLKEVA